jgi:hypothetical protein
MAVHRRDIDSSIGAEHPELLRLSRQLIPTDVEVLDPSGLLGFMVPAMYDEHFVTHPIELINDGPTDETCTPEDDYSHCEESCRPPSVDSGARPSRHSKSRKVGSGRGGGVSGH